MSEFMIHREQGGVKRFEAYLRGVEYSPHRHDTYAIAMTMAGVQCFNYRGASRYSLPGEVVVLHPDELHDGKEGTEEGFRYRALSIEPSLVQNVLGMTALPFIEGGLSKDIRLRKAVYDVLTSPEGTESDISYEHLIGDVVVALSETSGCVPAKSRIDRVAVEQCRHFLHDHLLDEVEMNTLESVTGLNKWQLSRDFKAVFGTSPYRYLIMRRLEYAKDQLRRGHSIADSAIASRFSDQAHFQRQFKKAYGLTPKRWIDLVSSI